MAGDGRVQYRAITVQELRAKLLSSRSRVMQRLGTIHSFCQKVGCGPVFCASVVADISPCVGCCSRVWAGQGTEIALACSHKMFRVIAWLHRAGELQASIPCSQYVLEAPFFLRFSYKPEHPAQQPAFANNGLPPTFLCFPCNFP